ncbi:nucleotidyltransferase domain-containing protein [Candidatus Bathyarchaeota archaeon]|nr:nucleotidyltransferase domain-containing protein [Candidatus Bathyarchaeota archaeon]
MGTSKYKETATSTMQGNQVIYSEEHWRNLAKLRLSASEMMKSLVDAHIYCIVYGSIARGDTSDGSDIDVYLPNPPSPTMIEATLESTGIRSNKREIVQATPNYAAKGYIYIDELKSYSFPLVPLRPSEEDFTGFAGRITYDELAKKQRVPGVNKDLVLIEPNEQGHTETPIKGIEGIVAKKLGVDTTIVHQRQRTLERRMRVGRTGVYIKRELAPDESFGTVFNEIANGNAAIRRRLRKKG